MPVYGVDVHDGYQAGLSFPTLFSQGYRFAAVKLTEGTGYVRDRADDWIHAAQAAGLIPGAYHWLTASDGAAQARWFHQHVTAAGGPNGWVIELDAEDDGYGPQIAAWTQEWRRLTGWYPFLIYSADWWWPRTGGFNGSLMTPYLWDAEYLTGDADTIPDDPVAFAARIPASWWTPGFGGWTRATMLQFTSRGDAGNLGNNIDLNVYPGSLELFRSTLTRGSDAVPDDQINELRDVVTALALGATDLGSVPGNTGFHVWTSHTNIAQVRADLAAFRAESAATNAALLTAVGALVSGGGTIDITALLEAVNDAAKGVGDRVLRELREAAVASATAMEEPNPESR